MIICPIRLMVKLDHESWIHDHHACRLNHVVSSDLGYGPLMYDGE